MISYAQNFEDVMLWRALKHVEDGFYIDLGAQDPVVDSVSKAFHEQGWHGIHVEPMPEYAQMLRQQRPGDTVIQAAVGKDTDMLKFFAIADTGISTASAKIAGEHRKRGFEVKETVVPSVTLSSIFKLCGDREIHWLKIDVEGFEKQALASWENSRARPWIVVVESTLPLTQIENHGQWESLLRRRHYDPVYFDGLNRFYISKAHPELAAAFQSPPGVFDGFALSGSASSSFHIAYKQQLESSLAAQAQANSAETERLAARIAAQDGAWKDLERTSAEQQEAMKHELRALEQDRLNVERTYAERMAIAQKELQSALHALAAREKEAGTQLLTIQQQAERQVTELALQLLGSQQKATHELAERDRLLRLEIADRERLLGVATQSAQEELRALQAERGLREKEHRGEIEKVRQELQLALQRTAQREQELGAQLLATQKLAEKEKSDGALAQQEALRTLQAEHTRIQDIHTENIGKLQQEIQSALQHTAQREQALGAQLLDAQKLAEKERVDRQIALDEERRVLQAERDQLDATHAENIGKVQQELQAGLQRAAKREQELGAQLLAAQNLAEKEKAGLEVTHAAQIERLHLEHAEREKTLATQLHALQQDRLQREQVLQQKAEQSRQTLDTLLRTLAQREQDIGVKLLDMQRRAENEKAALQQAHDAGIRGLAQAHAAREAALREESTAVQQELLNTNRLAGEREVALGAQLAGAHEQLVASQEEVRHLHGDIVRREQEFAARMLAMQQQADIDLRAQVHGAEERMNRLSTEHVGREKLLNETLQSVRNEVAALLQDRLKRERTFAEKSATMQLEILVLEKSLADRAQQFTAELANSRQELDDSTMAAAHRESVLASQLATLRDLNDQLGQVRESLSVKLHAERSALFDADRRLEAAKSDILAMVASLSWRVTAPLRLFSQFRGPSINTYLEPRARPDPGIAATIGAATPKQVSASAVSETPIRFSFESFPDDFNMTTILRTGELPVPNTLEELLAYQDLDFVRNAYRVLLKREADSTGELGYLALVRRGHDKVQLLADIRYSDEGRKVSAQLPGLDKVLRFRKLSKMPIVGQVVRFFRFLTPAPAGIDGNAAFESQSIALQGESLRRVSNVGALMLQLQQSNAPLSEELKRVADSQAAIASGLDRVQTAIVQLQEKVAATQIVAPVPVPAPTPPEVPPIVASAASESDGIDKGSLRELLASRTTAWKH